MANLAGIDRFAQANAVGDAETGCSALGAEIGKACALTGWSEMFSFIEGRRFAAERWSCAYKTGNFAHVEKHGKIINSLWKSLLKTLIYNGFRILLFQGGKKTLFLNFYKNHRKTRHFSLFPIKRENLH